MAKRSDYVYFSFVTIATVGYGDLTTQGGFLGRALAVTEGLLGQIYLVTAVAALVSNLGRRRWGARFAHPPPTLYLEAPTTRPIERREDHRSPSPWAS